MFVSAGILLQGLKASIWVFSDSITWSNTPQPSLLSALGAVPFVAQKNVHKYKHIKYKSKMDKIQFTHFVDKCGVPAVSLMGVTCTNKEETQS